MSEAPRGSLTESVVLPGARKKLIPSAVGLLVVSVLWMFVCVLIISYFYPQLDSPSTKSSHREFLIQFIGIMGALLMYSAMLAIGAFRMVYRGSYRWSVFVSVFSMIPFLSPFFILGIPFGLRVFMVIRKPDVRASFRSASHKLS